MRLCISRIRVSLPVVRISVFAVSTRGRLGSMFSCSVWVELSGLVVADGSGLRGPEVARRAAARRRFSSSVLIIPWFFFITVS